MLKAYFFLFSMCNIRLEIVVKYILACLISYHHFVILIIAVAHENVFELVAIRVI